MPHNDFDPSGTARGGRSPLATLARAAGLAAALLLPAAALRAQSVVPLGEDATTVPRGMVRLRVMPTWLRAVDQWTTLDGVRRRIPLGGELASDSLGARQLPALGESETLAQQLSGAGAVRLTLGRSVASASVRSVVTPFALEVGLTNRLTLGVTVPLVETRSRFALALNGDSTARFNAGANPALTGAAARAKNAAVAAQLDAASRQLESCLAGGATTGCEGVAADRAAAQALLASLQSARQNVGALYGVSSAAPGLPFVPLDTSAVQRAIDARLGELSAMAVAVLGQSYGISARPAGAAGPAGAALLRELFTAAGYPADSLAESNRIGVGDVEVGAKLLVRDLPAGATRGARVAVGALARLGTGKPDFSSPYGVGTGDGQLDVEGAVFVDALLSRRFALTLVTCYTVQTGETEAWLTDATGVRDVLAPVRASASLGDVLALDLTPRYRVASNFTLDAHYGLHRVGGTSFSGATADSALTVTPATTPASTVQRAGFGATYSTLERWRRGEARLPVDVVFAHLETVASGGGPALKLAQTQIQLRLYYPVFGR